QPGFEKYFASPFGRNSFMDSNRLVPQRGVSRSSRTRGGMRWTRQRFARRGRERASGLAVIASAAKQSILPRKERMDCFASLAMTVSPDARSRPRRAMRPRVCVYLSPLEGVGRNIVEGGVTPPPRYAPASH